MTHRPTQPRTARRQALLTPGLEPHAARALHDGLDDDGRGLLAVDCQQVGELGDVAVVERLGEARAGRRSEDLLGQHACEHRVHPVVGIAHRHAPEGVAVVAAPDGEQAPAGGPPLTPGELQGHLDGDVHRDRARVRQEDVVEPRGRDVDQRLGQLDRRVMGHPAEAAVLFTTGYAANLGVIDTMGRWASVICSDELNHASIIDGCRLARAPTRIYPHCDTTAVNAQLAGSEGRGMVVSDSVFSMDGDLAPIRDLAPSPASDRAKPGTHQSLRNTR